MGRRARRGLDKQAVVGGPGKGYLLEIDGRVQKRSLAHAEVEVPDALLDVEAQGTHLGRVGVEAQAPDAESLCVVAVDVDARVEVQRRVERHCLDEGPQGRAAAAASVMCEKKRG